MKLYEIFNQLKYQIAPDQEAIRANIINEVILKKQRLKKKIISYGIIAFFLALLASLLTIYIVNYFTFDTAKNISGDIASLSKVAYVSTDDFIKSNGSKDITVVTTEKMSVEELKNYLTTTPKTEFTVQKSGVNRFKLKFTEPLSPNKSYTINSVISDSVIYRWSLQTSASFSVTATSPSKNSKMVNIDTSVSVTFSESSVPAFKENFSISPTVEGDFYHNGRTWTFVPKQKLKPYTTYTVTIKKSISGLEELPLNQDYVFAFTTGYSEGRYAYAVNDDFDVADHFLSSQTPYAKIAAKGMVSVAADISVFKIKDAETYQKLHKKYKDTTPIISSAIENDIKSDSFTLYSQFSASAIKDTDDSEIYYFNYPKELENGYYVSSVKWEDCTIYQLIHVSDLHVYASSHNEKYNVWVNNVQIKSPVSGATVKIQDVTSSSDQNGLASLDSDSASNGVYVQVTYGNLPPYILYVQNSNAPVTDSLENYYYYMYTDRIAYGSDDIIKIWGYVAKRNTAADMPKVQLYTQWSDQAIPVNIGENGCFSAEIEINEYFDDFDSSITLQINGYKAYTQSIEVVDLNSLFTADFTPNKYAYFSGENASIDISANYTDQSPAAGISIESTGGIKSTTNKNGKTTQTFILNARPNANNSCLPEVRTINSKFKTATGKYVTHSLPLIIFNNNEFIQASLDDKTLKIKTSSIDFTKLNSLDYVDYLNQYNDLPENLYLGAPVSKEVTVEVHEITYERSKAGTYYDVNQKKYLNRYNYTQKDTVTSTLTLSTTIADGTATENIQLPSSSNVRYIKVSMIDGNGKECYTTIYLDQLFSNSTEYEFALSKSSPKAGDTVTLVVSNPSAMQYISGADFIYHIVTPTTYKTFIGEHSATFEYTDDLGPKATIYGSYFDGKTMHPISPVEIKCADTKNMQLSISSPQKEYKPKDKVTLNIDAKDPKGSPLSVAYNVILIDKANCDINVINSLNTSLGQKEIPFYNSVSAVQQNVEEASTEILYPTAVDIVSGMTNSNGQSNVSLSLPDYNSDWVVVVQAVSSTGDFENSYFSINAKQKHFLTLTAPSTATTVSDAVVSYRIDSVSTDATEVKFTLYQNDKAIKTITQTIAPNELGYANFGKLANGNYSVKAETASTFGPLANSKSFSVLNTQTGALQLNENANSASSILLIDNDFNLYAAYLNQLLSNGSNRIDRYIGSKFSEVFLTNFDTTESKKSMKQFLEKFKNDNGYSAISNNEPGDLFITVQLASLFPEQIDQDVALSCFDKVFKSKDATREDILLALWGKAALHQAVENDLAYYYAEGNGHTAEQYLYFALGYAFSGNHTKANEIFNQELLPTLNQDEKYVYLENENKNIENRCNAMLSLLLNRISSKYATKALTYFCDQDSPDMLSTFGILSFLTEYTPMLLGQNQIEICLNDGTKKEYSYHRCIPLGVNFGTRNIASFKNIKGTTKFYSPQTLSYSDTEGEVVSADVTYGGNGTSESITIKFDPALNNANHFRFSFPYSLIYSKHNVDTKNCIVDINNISGVVDVYTESVVSIKFTFKSTFAGTFVTEPVIHISYVDGIKFVSQTAPADLTPIVESETIPTL